MLILVFLEKIFHRTLGVSRMMSILKFRHIAALIIIGLVILSGMPVFVPEDANHDRKIDVRDAVTLLQMADHKASSANAADSGKNIAACDNTLKAIAGLKEIVPPTVETEKNFSSHFCFLISGAENNPLFLICDVVMEHSVSFSSVLSPPLYQPPIFS